MQCESGDASECHYFLCVTSAEFCFSACYFIYSHADVLRFSFTPLALLYTNPATFLIFFSQYSFFQPFRYLFSVFNCPFSRFTLSGTVRASYCFT